MLTCKFIKVIDHEKDAIAIADAARVEVDDWNGGKSVTLYQKEASKDPGVEYRIAQEDGAYDHCYIENAAGKTVQHVRWKT